MRLRSFRKISGWRVRSNERTKKGAIFVTAVFTLLAFTTLALGMVVLSEAYLKIAGLRKSSLQLEYASENGIKSGFHHFWEAAASLSQPVILTEPLAQELADSLRKGQTRVFETSLGWRFPVVIREAEGDLIWQSRTDCELESMLDGGGYVSAEFKLPILAHGEIRHLSARRKSSLEVRIGAAAGHLPLPLFSLLIDRDLEASQKETFVADNGIIIQTPSRNLLAGTLSSSAEPLIPRDATPLLEKGLKTKLFRPQDLSNAKLRYALGLEGSEAPVPEGVYLVKDSLGLGGIYVVGDIEEMVLAIDGTYQVISFQLAAGAWTLKFSPSESRTLFISPEGATSFDRVPIGIIMASGKINSLGGGELESSGAAALVREREVPSVLRGVQLTIVASDKIDISSHLVAQGLEWRNGIPYVKEEQTQLIIYSAGQEFQDEVSVEAGITVADASPLDITVQASLAAQGLGFEIEGAGRTVNLLGGLQAVDYLSGGNRLNLYSDLNSADLRSGFFAVPQTALPVMLFPLIETVDWKEY